MSQDQLLITSHFKCSRGSLRTNQSIFETSLGIKLICDGAPCLTWVFDVEGYRSQGFAVNILPAHTNKAHT